MSDIKKVELSKCPFCGAQPELADHLFHGHIRHPKHDTCPISHMVFPKISWNKRVGPVTVTIDTSNIKKMLDDFKREIEDIEGQGEEWKKSE